MLAFSAVMSVYAGDKPEQLAAAVESLLNQTTLAKEIILVRDGPVSKDLQNELDQLKLNKAVNIIELAYNTGAANARQVGINASKTEIIALMDADDICVNNRFEAQLETMKRTNADVVGGVIEEFDQSVGDLKIRRVMPVDHDEIARLSMWRNPINNVTLMFKKSVFQQSGGYSDVRLSEDWDFILKVLASGFRVHNSPDTLVHVRSGNSMLARRRRMEQVIAEIKLFWRMYNNGIMSFWHLVANTIVRLVVRILPVSFTRMLYAKFLRTN
jgi:amylovoran biosynthesis glycosyltransferase AmsE